MSAIGAVGLWRGEVRASNSTCWKALWQVPHTLGGNGSVHGRLARGSDTPLLRSTNKSRSDLFTGQENTGQTPVLRSKQLLERQRFIHPIILLQNLLPIESSHLLGLGLRQLDQSGPPYH